MSRSRRRARGPRVGVRRLGVVDEHDLAVASDFFHAVGKPGKLASAACQSIACDWPSSARTAAIAASAFCALCCPRSVRSGPCQASRISALAWARVPLPPCRGEPPLGASAYQAGVGSPHLLTVPPWRKDRPPARRAVDRPRAHSPARHRRQKGRGRSAATRRAAMADWARRHSRRRRYRRPCISPP